MNKETQTKMKEIQAVENKYGLVLFRMGLTHLVEVGMNHLDDDSVEEGIKQILSQGKIDEANGKITVMTPDFQCNILRCAHELTHFSIWTLFTYIKKYVAIGNL